jgi:hypothetical protein
VTSRQKRIVAAIQALELASPTNEVTPRALWESARDEGHPLHDEFEWDDAVAAEAHRDEQARRLLRLRVTFVHEDRVIDAPICVRTPERGASEAGYTRTTKVVSDREQSKRVMLEELDRAARAVERARLVATALGYGGECEALLAQLTALKQKQAAA